MFKKGQNLIEFVIVTPLLVVILFGIIELSMFWKTTQNVQEIALEAAEGAAAQFVNDNSNPNPAVTKAVDIVTKRLKSLGLSDVTLADNPQGDSFGVRPYAMYEYKSNQTRNVDSIDTPIVTFTVDYRDPYTNGVITQLAYQYRTILLGAEFTIPGGRKITLIPRDMEISSTKIQQYINY